MADNEDAEKLGPLVEGKIAVTDVFGLGQATKNLTPVAVEVVKALAGGLGKLYEPASLYLNSVATGAANRKNALSDAQAYLDLETRRPAVLEAMKERILSTEYRRQENIDAAQEEAVKLAQERPAPEAKPIHPDFVAEWLEGVKDVSDETVRHYWAEMLAFSPTTEAGRVEKPVVDFLRSLDAELCQQLEYIYRESYPTLGVHFGSIFGDPLAAEIGLGKVISEDMIETRDGTLKIRAVDGVFQVFKLGERATRLGEVTFNDIDEEAALATFYEGLHDMFSIIELVGTAERLTIEIQAPDGFIYEFLMRLKEQLSVNGKPANPPDAAALELKLGNSVSHRALVEFMKSHAHLLSFQRRRKNTRIPL